MRVHESLRNLFFGLIVIYFSQGVFYSQGSVIAKLALVMIFIICVFYFLLLLLRRRRNPPIFSIWTFFMITNFVGFVLSGDYGNSNSSGMIRSVLITSLSFYPVFYLTYKNKISHRYLMWFFFIMLPIVLLSFNSTQNQLQIDRNRLEVVNNAAYTLVYFLPYIFLIRCKRFNYVGFLFVFLNLFFIINSAKRSALVVGLLFFVVYAFYYYRLQIKSSNYVSVFFGMGIIVVLSLYILDFIYNNDFLLFRLEDMAEGNSSGRDLIFDKLFLAWSSSESIISLLFGFGFASSPIITGGSVAHNDWLELLVNFGLIGVFLFLILFIILLKNIFHQKMPFEDRVLLFSIVMVMFLMGFVSRWYSSIDGYTMSILIGFLFGLKYKKLTIYS